MISFLYNQLEKFLGMRSRCSMIGRVALSWMAKVVTITGIITITV